MLDFKIYVRILPVNSFDASNESATPRHITDSAPPPNTVHAPIGTHARLALEGVDWDRGRGENTAPHSLTVQTADGGDLLTHGVQWGGGEGGLLMFFTEEKRGSGTRWRVKDHLPADQSQGP